MNTFFETFRGLGPVRLGMMAAVAAGIIAFFIYLTGRLTTPDMVLLYADLEAQDSAKIVSKLDSLNAPYRIGKDGSQIFASATDVPRLRIAMAEDGLPNGGSIGYEIFDRSEGLGTTKFVQNINHLRALEGELSRTIRSIDRVKSARVHLVLPRRELFSREQQEPTASIVLTMQGNNRLSRQQIQAIQHLVSAAVPGLKPTMISIVDAKGALLARSTSEGDIENTTSTAAEMRATYESRMIRTIETLLEQSVGVGNVRAQVVAEIDFDRITENAEIFDPDGQVVRSTQIVEEASDSAEGQSTPPVSVGNNLPDANLPSLGDSSNQSRTSRTEETTNFEITRTMKTHVREAGIMRRLSVAVMINGITGVDANGESTYEPRSPEEMEQLATLVRTAVGFDQERGDTVEIANMRFAEEKVEEFAEEDSNILGIAKEDLMEVAELLVLGVVAMLVLLLVVRPLISRLIESGALDPKAQIAGQSGDHLALGGPGDVFTGQIEGPDGDTSDPVADEIEQMIDINKVEGRVRASSVRKIGEIVDKHPDEAVAIIRSWLYQET